MSRAEVVKLARVLCVDEAELAPLEAVPAKDLAALREQVTDRLFGADPGHLHRIAESSRILPVAVMATIGRRAFGPLICARLAGMIEPDRAVEVALRWPDEFAAAVAAEMDPRRASAVVTDMPADRVVAIAAILAREGEYVAMGRFVGHLDPDALRACVAAIDEEALLRTAYVLEGGEGRLEEIVASLPDERLRALAGVAREHGLDEELEHLRSHLKKRQTKRLDSALSAVS